MIKMQKKKLILLLIGICICWLFVMPQIVSSTINFVCKNSLVNSEYELNIAKPNLRFSILPICNINLDKVLIKSKKDSTYAIAENIQICLRLLPLLSGELHLNKLEVEKIFLSTDINDGFELKQDFFERFNNRRFRFDMIKLGEFESKIYQNDIKNPIIYKGKNFEFQRRNRYVKLHNES